MSSICNDFEPEASSLFKSVADDCGLHQHNVKKTADSAKGEGYMAVITYGQMTGTNSTLNLVIKTTLKSKGIRENLPVREFFEREIYMYDIVLPSFRQFLTSKSMPFSLNFPKCYKTTAAMGSEALILENLKMKGYSLWDRRKPMNKDHITLAMKSYGSLHALSFALRHQQPDHFQKMSKDLDEIFVLMLRSVDIGKLFTGLTNDISAMIKATEGESVEIIYRRFIAEMPDFLKKMSKWRSNYSVITHGDCWSNNVMFKYGDCSNSNVPTDMSFIDFQASRLGPPVLDLAYFFHVCSSKEIIDNTWRYLDIYYSSLKDCLDGLGSNVDVLYPYEVFKQQWKEFAKFGLMMASLAIKIMLTEPQEVVNFTDLSQAGKPLSDLFDHKFARAEEYNERIRHLILHFIKNDLI